MPRPQFVVQHFLVCQDAPWQGAAGPRTLRTLEGVGYYQTVPADAEMPELDLWAYLRLFLTNGVSGQRRLWVEVYWLDAPEASRRLRSYPVSQVQFWAHSPVAELTLRINGLQIPGRGRLEFRLLFRKRSRLHGVRSEVMAREYIHIG